MREYLSPGHGCTDARMHGLRGCAAVRLCGCAAVRLCGCAAVRLCGGSRQASGPAPRYNPLMNASTTPQNRPVPPGPRGTFLGGNLPQFRQDRLEFLTRCAREFGDVVALRLGPRRDAAAEPPGRHRASAGHSKSKLHQTLCHPDESARPGQGTARRSEGSFWLRHRRLAQPAFQRQRINAYGLVMVEHDRADARTPGERENRGKCWRR